MGLERAGDPWSSPLTLAQMMPDTPDARRLTFRLATLEGCGTDRGVGRAELGQVVDPEVLASAEGPRGRLRVCVPVSWATSGAGLRVAVPARVECARCDGGGCDGCARSGALRTPDDPTARTLRVELPAGSVDGIALRLVRPFGEAAAIEQLLVEVRCGERASECVARVKRPALRGPGPARASSLRGPRALGLALIATSVLAALVGLLASR